MRYVWLLLLCFQLNFILAQDTIKVPDLAISFSPSAFANVFQGLQFGLEKSIAEKETLEAEAAWIFPQVGNQEIKKQGYRLKLGYKKYGRYKSVALATIYCRRTRHFLQETVSRFNDEFFQEIEFEKTKTLIGFTMGYGVATSFLDNFWIEFSVNAGPGLYYVKNYQMPDDVTERRFLFDAYKFPGSYFYPIIGVSLKFKYQII